MVKFMWLKNNVPDNLTVKQVYGIVFSNDGRILLRIEDNKYKLTGGKPEENESYEETLKREYIEELNIELAECYYLGYLLVEDNNEKYAQVRMIAKIKKINDKRPDTDNGKVYDRRLVTFDKVKEYLNYQDEAGNLMIDDAIKIARKKYDFPIINSDEEFI